MYLMDTMNESLSYNYHFRWRVCEEVRVLHLGQWGVGCTAGSGDIQSAGVPRDGQRGKWHDRSSSSMQQSQNSSSNTQSNSSSNIQTNTQSSNSSSNTCSQIHYWTHNKVKGNVKDTEPKFIITFPQFGKSNGKMIKSSQI